MKCSNCESEISDLPTALIVTRGTTPVATLCDACCTGVLTMKIVLSRREKHHEFTFEGYLPVASAKTV
jgi:hypothetical protein